MAGCVMWAKKQHVGRGEYLDCELTSIELSHVATDASTASDTMSPSLRSVCCTEASDDDKFAESMLVVRRCKGPALSIAIYSL